jgi:hypothetical protein
MTTARAMDEYMLKPGGVRFAVAGTALAEVWNAWLIDFYRSDDIGAADVVIFVR